VFPGRKGGRCIRLTTLLPSCAVVMKSGNLNFLEPSGPLQACNGTALPLPIIKRVLSPPSRMLSLSIYVAAWVTVSLGHDVNSPTLLKGLYINYQLDALIIIYS
jgi:hypothetical protein